MQVKFRTLKMLSSEALIEATKVPSWTFFFQQSLSAFEQKLLLHQYQPGSNFDSLELISFEQLIEPIKDERVLVLTLECVFFRFKVLPTSWIEGVSHLLPLRNWFCKGSGHLNLNVINIQN